MVVDGEGRVKWDANAGFESLLDVGPGAVGEFGLHAGSGFDSGLARLSPQTLPPSFASCLRYLIFLLSLGPKVRSQGSIVSLRYTPRAPVFTLSP